MYHFAPLLLSFVASAVAYTVTEPSAAQPWTLSGPQRLSWDRVSTDPSTFTVVLTNMDNTMQQVLAAEVNGDLKTINLNPISGGWPEGEGYRINLVKDVNHLDTILAQSGEYNIGVSSAPLASSAATQTATSPTTSAAHTTFSVSAPTTSIALSVTASSSKSAATLPALSSSITSAITPTTSTSRVTTPTSSATSSRTSSNAGTKMIATRVGFVPFLVALNYLLV